MSPIDALTTAAKANLADLVSPYYSNIIAALNTKHVHLIFIDRLHLVTQMRQIPLSTGDGTRNVLGYEFEGNYYYVLPARAFEAALFSVTEPTFSLAVDSALKHFVAKFEEVHQIKLYYKLTTTRLRGLAAGPHVEIFKN